MKEFNECYLSATRLKMGDKLVFVVGAESSGSYSLITYWSDIEHLNMD